MIRTTALFAALMAGLIVAPAAQAVPPDPAQVTVTRSGLQLGTVTDSDGQINCGSDCSGSYAWACAGDNGHGACIGWEPPFVSLSASPPAGFGVTWVGVTCSEGSNLTNDCSFDGAATVEAHFRDLTAPVVTLTAPAAGVVKGTIPLSATASDPQTSVSNVQFRVGGTPVGAADTTAPYTGSFDTTSRSDGDVSVAAVATNNDGSVASSTATITIDNTAPTLNNFSGPNGQTFGAGTTQTWNFTPTDANGVADLKCSVVASGASPSFEQCTSPTSHTVSGKPDGSYTFLVHATDVAGNEFTAAARTFSIDATPPETTIGSGPADGSSSTDTTAVFGFSAGQAGSTFQCRVYPAAFTPPAFGECSAAAGHTATGFAPGTYSFEVRATDPYGNTDASPAKRTFTVTAPSGGGTDSGTGGTTTDPGTPSDPGTPVDPGPPAPPPPAPPFDPRISSGFDYKGPRTTFKVLALRSLPKGSKVVVTCKGRGCKFKRRAIATSGSKLNVLKKLRRIVLRSGAVLQLTITGPQGQRKVATWKVRTGKSPALTYRCAAPGGKLGRCA